MYCYYKQVNILQARHDHIENEDIWLQMKQGNGKALVEIYDLYADLLYSYGRKFTAKSEIIEDAMQDLLTELWVKREKLSVPHSAKGYLLKAFRQKLLRQLSKYKKISFLENYPETMTGESKSNGMAEEDAEQIVTLKAHLKNSLSYLSPKQREAILLKYTENLTHDEIAEVMEIKKQSLYNLLHGAIQRLSETMKHERASNFVYFLSVLLLFSHSNPIIF
ncbi:RNA polymerase sigma factor (sigma-70 family) [Catalinimonas alkaloidigena]|uniref:RNA polymerase sigma factor n=1 Tax=Catalinimonas alkaloidigena TaxID=1075417 RepID=UPI00240611F1|nr:sigma-70 family RNA polymerase sigma factor [Catalinimonas alkaloidigena]MDF9796951.1 RNA polymerase sigma factor (sigma-70 family) [Catalinimonas alkaloidigena]